MKLLLVFSWLLLNIYQVSSLFCILLQSKKKCTSRLRIPCIFSKRHFYYLQVMKIQQKINHYYFLSYCNISIKYDGINRWHLLTYLLYSVLETPKIPVLTLDALIFLSLFHQNSNEVKLVMWPTIQQGYDSSLKHDWS